MCGRMEITLRSIIRGGGEDWIQFYKNVSRKRDLGTMVNQSTTSKSEISFRKENIKKEVDKRGR